MSMPPSAQKPAAVPLGTPMLPKRSLLAIHKYVALTAALFILIQSITGMMLVYRVELARLLDSQGMVRHSMSGDAPLSAVLDSIQRENPGYAIQRLVYPAAPDGTYFAHLVNAEGTYRYASTDPGNGRILRSGSIWSFPVEAALFVHFRLMTGRLGLMIVLLTGLSVVVLAATGLMFWWPRRGRIGKNMKIDLRLAPRLILRQCHRSLGVFISLILLISASTGLFVGTIFMLADGPIYGVAPTGALPRVDPAVDDMLALARAQFPGHAIRDIRMPAPATFNVHFLAPAQGPSAVHTVHIDRTSRSLVRKTAAADDTSLWAPVLPIHNGELFGNPGRILVLLAGLSLAVLAVTGPIMWFQARRPHRKPAAAPIVRNSL